jgi:hypothetical protein
MRVSFLKVEMKIKRVKHRQGPLTCVPLWKVTVILTVWIVMLFSAPLWAKPKRSYGPTHPAGAGWELPKSLELKSWDMIGQTSKESRHTYIARRKKSSYESRELTPDENERLNKKRMEWEALPPEKQKVLRQRMKELKGLPPGDRELFRQRYNQWKNLSPEERQGIRQDLDRWDRLSPQEQERIRRRFLNR